MKTMIGAIKARHMASDFGRNRDELAWKLLNVQRNLNAGAIENDGSDRNGNDGNAAAQPGSGSGEGGSEDD